MNPFERIIQALATVKTPGPFSFLSQINDRSRWSYVLTMPVFLIIFSYLLVGSHYFQTWKTFLGATAVNGVLLTCIFITQTGFSEKIARKYATLQQTLTRVSLTIVTQSILTGLFVGLVSGLYIHFRLFQSTLTYSQVMFIYSISIVALILTNGIRESIHAIEQWKEHQTTKEKLRKENVKGQLQSLKAQVNPHFLFNSLNSLSILISEEPEKAEEFVAQMARVYRYLLQTNQTTNEDGKPDELTTLSMELAFIDSYGHLLKTRHGEGMQLKVTVDEKYLEYRLPPLTLQLLVENAVKHNVVRSSQPLEIEISTLENGLLQVRNNLQKKSFSSSFDRSESTQVGLTNIKTKYQLLAQLRPGLTEPWIEAGPDYFTVTLPLI